MGSTGKGGSGSKNGNQGGRQNLRSPLARMASSCCSSASSSAAAPSGSSAGILSRVRAPRAVWGLGRWRGGRTWDWEPRNKAQTGQTRAWRQSAFARRHPALPIAHRRCQTRSTQRSEVVGLRRSPAHPGDTPLGRPMLRQGQAHLLRRLSSGARGWEQLPAAATAALHHTSGGNAAAATAAAPPGPASQQHAGGSWQLAFAALLGLAGTAAAGRAEEAHPPPPDADKVRG